MSVSAYPTYRESGVEWLGSVPTHWSVAPLKRAVRLITERTSRRDHPIGLENVESWSGRLVESGAEFEGDGVPFEAGDVLYGKLRPYLAKVYASSFRGEAVGDFHVLRPSEAAQSKYIAYQLLTPEVVSILNGSTFGAKMPRVGWDFMGGLPVAIPPTPEQTAIAAFLDRETARIDALIEEQERLIALLKEKRQAVISHAVTKGLDPTAPMKDSGVEWLGEVPAHWEVTRLANLFREIAEPLTEELPLLSVSIHHGVSDDELDEGELDRKVTRSEDRSKYKRVQPKDIVYNMMRAWQGGFGTVSVNGGVSPAYVVARPKIPIETAFVEWVLRTPQCVEEMRTRSVGVIDFRLRLYWDEFKELRIALPPVAEQQKLIEEIGAEVERYRTLTYVAADAIALLKERRSALISAAVTGKIDVRGVLKPKPEFESSNHADL